jgi:hypothetical protein
MPVVDGTPWSSFYNAPYTGLYFLDINMPVMTHRMPGSSRGRRPMESNTADHKGGTEFTSQKKTVQVN